MRNLPQGAPFDPLMRFFPDLVPVAVGSLAPGPMVTGGFTRGPVAGPSAYCRRDGQGNLLVQITNLGRFAAGPSTTRVVYQGGQTADRATPALGQDQSVVLTFPNPFSFPANTPDRSFVIIADVFNQVRERNKLNNQVNGLCF